MTIRLSLQPRQQFGRLTVLRMSHIDGRGNVMYNCICQCGNTCTARGSHLKNGNRQSCGCLRGQASVTHGHSRNGTVTPEYKTWAAMHDRCRNPHCHQYENYGGRGIIVCDRWSAFELFLKDMGSRPSGTSLDRWPDPNGNYEPPNCRWANPTQQARNSRHTKLNEATVREIKRRLANDERQNALAAEFSVSKSTINLIAASRIWKDI